MGRRAPYFFVSLELYIEMFKGCLVTWIVRYFMDDLGFGAVIFPNVCFY